MDANSDRIDQLLRAAVPEIAEEFHRVNRATTGNVNGERLLAIAVLETAVEDWRGGHHEPGMHRPCQHCEAAEWFSSGDESWIFSFVAVCDHLGVNPEAVRAEVLGKRRVA